MANGRNRVMAAEKAVSHFGERLTRRQHLLRSLITSGPAILWTLIFLIVPLVAIVVISLLTRGTYGEIGRPFTTENYRRFLGFGELGFDPLYLRILGRSLAMGAGTVALCVGVALPLAFFIAGLPGRWKNLALTLVIIPFWVNLLIRTYAWQILLAPNGLLTEAFVRLGLHAADTPMYPSAFAVYLGLVCDFLPFMVLPLYSSVEKLDWSLPEAAMDLGANRRQVFRHAILPQIMPGLVAGVILVFVPATGQFVIPDLLGGAKTVMLGNAINQQFCQSRDWPFGAAIACLAMAVVLVGLWLYARTAREQGGEAIL